MHVPRDILITNVFVTWQNMILKGDASRLAIYISLGHRNKNSFWVKWITNPVSCQRNSKVGNFLPRKWQLFLKHFYNFLHCFGKCFQVSWQKIRCGIILWIDAIHTQTNEQTTKHANKEANQYTNSLPAPNPCGAKISFKWGGRHTLDY